ncbi:MAG TPA: MgtC/SapB family protein [Acidimicrobiales bacterium]|nr:MgtC/SapB family protein [Acidimicrobiales bacterium]
MPSALLVSTSGTNIEGWRQIGELCLAVVLSAAIGLEREVRHKDAGIRTHTLVGTGAALFMLMSKYGFADVIEPNRVVLDPSRVGAQIVSGIGFVGAGLIFVRGGSVRGLTTAAGVWMTAAVGAAAGAGLPVLAAVTTGIYFVVSYLFPVISAHLPKSSTASSIVRVRYPDGQGVLRELLQLTTSRGFSLGGVTTEKARIVNSDHGHRTVRVELEVRGKPSVHELASALSEIDGVEAGVAEDVNTVDR